jgi:hypothetical protein
MPRKTTATRQKRTRVRSKRLDQLDESKLALALWLLAKETISDSSDHDRHSTSPRKLKQ